MSTSIVELAATQAYDQSEQLGASFAEVVQVDDEILQMPSVVLLHDISAEEIFAALVFATVRDRLLEYVEAV